MNATNNAHLDALSHVGLPDREVGDWLAGRPQPDGGWDDERQGVVKYWHATNSLLDRLPPKQKRSKAEQLAADVLLDAGRKSRETFLGKYVANVYAELTQARQTFLRVDELVTRAAEVFPGLTPSKATLDRENECMQRDKDGHEIDQGILLSHVLAHPDCGMHLCHGMLLPSPRALALLPEFKAKGRVDLGTGFVEREGSSAAFTLNNPRFLNAEDNSTVDIQEIGVDLCTLDADSDIAVLRGARMESGKYKGKRVYCTGINLTQLYHGNIPYLWYMKRDLGWINKVFRGLAVPDRSPDEILGFTQEKLWISAIDSFAIGGGCQYTLVTDYNIAARDAYLTLPARKEGIVPGAANLRMHRFLGDRITRQAVMMDRRIDCDSPEGRMICDRIVEPGTVDQAVAEVADMIAKSGVVSASSNRKSFRVAHEPLDAFRRYMAVYAREQANCHFSPALIRNLEQFWGAHERRIN